VRRRHRSFPKRQLWSTWVQFVKEERWAFAKIWTTIPLICILISLVRPGWLTGFITGGLLFFALGITGFVFAASTGGLSQVLGVLCEGYTREEIAGAVKDKHVWSAVHNLELDTGDLDHLVLAPAGCLAVETKFYGSRHTASLLEEHVQKMSRTALRAQGLMNTTGHRDVPICATVLVAWGRLGPTGISQHGDVVVVHGSELRKWLGRYGTGPLGEDIALALKQDLDRFASRRQALTNSR
jgi:hypothetical protein